MNIAQRISHPSGFMALALFLATPMVHAVNQWNGGGDGADWFDGANWSEGVPAIGQEVSLATGNVLLTNETAALASFSMSGGTLTFSNWTTRLQADTVTVSGGALTLPPAFTENQMSNRVWIACEDFTLGTNAAIQADSRGYGPAQGPGKAASVTSGAGHGGTGSPGNQGWDKAGSPYDDVLAPWMPGSGGGDPAGGGCGGGAVWVQATDHVTIFGTVSADGQDGVTVHNGGGSGGSIRIDCETFHGSPSGWLRARGGNGFNLGGPGSGGRIAILYNPAAQAALVAPNPGVKFSAGAGTTGNNAALAEPGTLYLPAMETLFLDTMLTTQWDDIVAHIPGFDTWEVSSLTVAGKMNLPSVRVLVITNDFSIASGGMLSLNSGPTNGKLPIMGCWLAWGVPSLSPVHSTWPAIPPMARRRMSRPKVLSSGRVAQSTPMVAATVPNRGRAKEPQKPVEVTAAPVRRETEAGAMPVQRMTTLFLLPLREVEAAVLSRPAMEAAW